VRALLRRFPPQSFRATTVTGRLEAQFAEESALNSFALIRLPLPSTRTSITDSANESVAAPHGVP
jgi:hypothetical protein